MIRIFVVDDHALFREGLRALLEAQKDLSWVGDAESRDEALARLATVAADVVLMDVNMPGRNGVETTRALLARAPEMRIVMLSMVEEEASMFAALQAGARGYILKGADVGEMLDVIRAVADGRLMFSGPVAERVLSRLRDATEAEAPRRDGAFAELTGRERELLELMARGLNNSQIAEALLISPRTVRNHITNVFSKLEVADRAQAIVMAREAGFGRG